MRTRVGYAGGTTPAPTYHNLGDHTESIQIDYDPTRTSFADLLAEYWAMHDPAAPAWSRQYLSAIWTHDAIQEHDAKASRDRLEAALGRPVLTEIRPLEVFHLAEDYHQKYRLRSDRVLSADFATMYPQGRGLTDSTAAARVNGFVGGEGSLADLMREADRYGLSEVASAHLTDLVEARSRNGVAHPLG